MNVYSSILILFPFSEHGLWHLFCLFWRSHRECSFLPFWKTVIHQCSEIIFFGQTFNIKCVQSLFFDINAVKEDKINLWRNKVRLLCDKVLFLIRFCDHEYMGHKPPLATKSLDNIFARQLTYGTEQGSPFLWQDATRSEEQLYHAPHTFSGTTCFANKASRFSGARFVEDSGFILFVFNLHRRVCNMVSWH